GADGPDGADCRVAGTASGGDSGGCADFCGQSPFVRLDHDVSCRAVGAGRRGGGGGAGGIACRCLSGLAHEPSGAGRRAAGRMTRWWRPLVLVAMLAAAAFAGYGWLRPAPTPPQTALRVSAALGGE